VVSSSTVTIGYQTGYMLRVGIVVLFDDVSDDEGSKLVVEGRKAMTEGRNEVKNLGLW
jgi:hypothetical protein